MRLPLAEVTNVDPSKLLPMPMPQDLVDSLNAGGLRNLLAFLQWRGHGLEAGK
ncbi:MAG: hypothetical protein JNK49_09820 [Planctomycetes bacterium]|nr:hypothetical protein [Planctomycetota bacterium]